MTTPWSQLRRWLIRAQPPIRSVVLALSAGIIAAATGVALFVGAPYLLAFSSTETKLIAGSSLAVVLIVVELFAFLRSPLRFVERLTTHDLGLRSVTKWRRWLVVTIGSWSFSQWRSASSGDLLERAMSDTDALQDLWIRCIVPLVSVTVALLGADVFVSVLSSNRFRPYEMALVLVVVQFVVLAALASQLARLTHSERVVRRQRAIRTALQIELQIAAREIELLGRRDYFVAKIAIQNSDVERAEYRRSRHWRLVRFIVAFAPVVSLAAAALVAGENNLGLRSGLVVVLVALVSSELANVASQSLRVAVSVSVSAERLDALRTDQPNRAELWPSDHRIDVTSLTWSEGDYTVLDNISFTVPALRRIAITGPIGAGKSTLLRLLARLDETDLGEITVGDVAMGTIDELSLRRNLSYVSADPGLLEGNVDAVLRAGRPNAGDIEPALSELSISFPTSGRFEHLSRGEARRVALVRALLNEPDVVLLDEPTSGLGPSERALVMQRLGQLRATIIVATHDEQLANWCDDRYELRSGQLSRVIR